MKVEEINDWLQVVGFVAVAVSLVFVGFEIKQSRDIAMADIYQQRTEFAIQLITDSHGNEAFVSGMAKLRRGEELTEYEHAQITANLYRWLNHGENLHFQYEAGLLTQEQWDAWQNALRRMFQDDSFLEAWKSGQDTWRASYANMINNLLEQSNSHGNQQSK